eukprot:GILK01012474.1.p1 GENE.GILK01012474.1~~GILK01012474.1.p1  ORF type:complete len:845 (+),score=124.51 GILK01012474.1:29-2536(+)
MESRDTLRLSSARGMKPLNEHAYKLVDKGAMTGFMFPGTRTVLWDSTPQGEATPFVKPKCTISIPAHVTKAIRSFLQEKKSKRTPTSCVLVGNMSSSSARSKHDAVSLTIDRFDIGNESMSFRTSSGQLIPIPAVSFKDDVNVPVLERVDSSVAIQADEYEALCKHFLQLLKSRSLLPSDYSCFISTMTVNRLTASLSMHIEQLTPALSLKFVPINTLRLVSTPLSRSFAEHRATTSASTMRTGYLTLDQYRKGIPLLDTDPMAFDVPVVGIWITSVPALQDLAIYRACIRYLFNESIRERASNGTDSFLLLWIPPNSTKQLFYEVKYELDVSCPLTVLTASTTLDLSSNSDRKERSDLQVVELESSSVTAARFAEVCRCVVQQIAGASVGLTDIRNSDASFDTRCESMPQTPQRQAPPSPYREVPEVHSPTMFKPMLPTPSAPFTLPASSVPIKRSIDTNKNIGNIGNSMGIPVFTSHELQPLTPLKNTVAGSVNSTPSRRSSSAARSQITDQIILEHQNQLKTLQEQMLELQRHVLKQSLTGSHRFSTQSAATSPSKAAAAATATIQRFSGVSVGVNTSFAVLPPTRTAEMVERSTAACQSVSIGTNTSFVIPSSSSSTSTRPPAMDAITCSSGSSSTPATSSDSLKSISSLTNLLSNMKVSLPEPLAPRSPQQKTMQIESLPRSGSPQNQVHPSASQAENVQFIGEPRKDPVGAEPTRREQSAVEAVKKIPSDVYGSHSQTRTASHTPPQADSMRSSVQSSLSSPSLSSEDSSSFDESILELPAHTFADSTIDIPRIMYSPLVDETFDSEDDLDLDPIDLKYLRMARSAQKT